MKPMNVLEKILAYGSLEDVLREKKRLAVRAVELKKKGGVNPEIVAELHKIYGKAGGTLDAWRPNIAAFKKDLKQAAAAQAEADLKGLVEKESEVEEEEAEREAA